MPTVAGDNVLLGTDRGLAVYDRETGERRWIGLTFDDIRTPPLAAFGLFWVGDSGSMVYGFDPADGTKVVERTIGDSSLRSLTAHGDALYVGSFAKLRKFRVE